MRNCFQVLFFFLTCMISSIARSQTSSCPSNLDFEQGNFGNWDLVTGIAVPGNVNWTGNGQVTNRHELIQSSLSDWDPYGGFPIACPNGSGFSVKLGNSNTGAEAEGMSYSFTIPSNISSFSIIYHYAVVFQDPGHDASEQPRFVARIINVSDNTEINCVSFSFTASASLPGFVVSPYGLSGTVMYKDWTPVSLNLTAYAGKSVRLEFITSDCTRGGHFGYAYVDVSSNCSGKIDGASACAGTDSTTLTAPYGFQTYEWYSGTNFSQFISDSQQLVLNPLPAIGTNYSVIVDPFPGFGCRDTLYATVDISPIPVAGFSVIKDTLCITDNLFQFENNSTVASGEPLTWHWQFSDGTQDRSKNPLKHFSETGQYYAKLVVTSISHCKDSISGPVMTVVSNGKPDFTWDSVCIGRTTRFQNLSSLNGALSVNYHWDFRNGVVSDIESPPGFIYDSPGILGVSLTMTAYGCETAPQNMTKNVWVNAPAKNIRYNDITLPPGYSRYLEARDRIGDNYNWQPAIQLNNYSIKNPLFQALDDVQYNISIVDPHTCITVDTQQVWILKKPGLYLPSAFTPNGDRLNDVVIPYLIGMKKLKRFSIFNRYGNVVFTTTTENQGWDGTYKGKLLDTAVFVWFIEYIDNNDKLITRKGSITLIQ